MTLLAGAAHLDITPPLGAPMEGYWYARRVSGVIDPLFVHALVLAVGDSIGAIVTADLCMLPHDWLDESVQYIQNRSKIPCANAFIACSHTHTGPITGQLVSPGKAEQEYREFVVRRIADVVELARQRLTSVRVGVGERIAPGLAFNRRLLGAEGKVITFKPDTSAAGVQPAGPVDHHVRVFYVEDSDGHPIAAVVNFGLHPDTTGGTLISADYPGILANTLERMLGGSPEILFLNGACGDINHLDPHHSTEPYCRDNAIRIGESLAAEAYQATRNPHWIEATMLKTGREKVMLGVRMASPEQIESARKIVNARKGEPTMPLARARSLLNVAARPDETIITEVSAITLGEVAFVGLPGEMFAAWGLRIHSTSPFAFNLVAELTNDYIGYIPTREAFPQGGYETELGQASFAEESAGEKLVDATQRLLCSLERGESQSDPKRDN